VGCLADWQRGQTHRHSYCVLSEFFYRYLAKTSIAEIDMTLLDNLSIETMWA
jgi:hypothetical protein